MRFFKHRATFCFSLLGVIVFYFIFHQLEQKIHGGLGIESLMLQFTFSSNKFFEITSSWFPNGIEIWAKMLWLDMLFPFVYVILLLSLLSRSRVSVIFFYQLSIFLGILDILENSLHLMLIYQSNHTILIPLAATFATLKWIAIAAILIAVIATLLYRYLSRSKPVRYE